MSELGQSLTSRWISAAGRFGHTPERPLVIFFVEGNEDVPFWEEAIKPYLDKYDIQVRTNKAVNPNEGNGKTCLLKMSGLGKNKVVAVDADFDLLIDDYSAYTEIVRNNPYVINTTWYSLENILMQKVGCLPLLENFSTSIKSHFIKYLVGVSSKTVKPKNDFGELLRKLNIQKHVIAEDFSDIVACEEIDEQSQTLIQEKLNEMGVPDADLWKLMRGHNLWNTIVKPVEERKINGKIQKQIDEMMKDGISFNRGKAMNMLGINCSVKEFLENSFYSEELELAPVPEKTRMKLNSIFS